MSATKVKRGRRPAAAHRATGPRGMALVPGDQADLLTTLDLPDAPLHDHLHQLLAALQKHQRPAAAQALAALEQRPPIIP